MISRSGAGSVRLDAALCGFNTAGNVKKGISCWRLKDVKFRILKQPEPLLHYIQTASAYAVFFSLFWWRCHSLVWQCTHTEKFWSFKKKKVFLISFCKWLSVLKMFSFNCLTTRKRIYQNITINLCFLLAKSGSKPSFLYSNLI